MATEDKKVEGQEQQETGEQQPEKKKGGAMSVVKKVFTIGEKVVMAGLTGLGAYALYKAVKPEPKTGSTESNE